MSRELTRLVWTGFFLNTAVVFVGFIRGLEGVLLLACRTATPQSRTGAALFRRRPKAVLRRRQAGVLEGTWTRRGVVRRSGGGRWSAEGGGPYAVSELWVVALIGERQVQPGAPCADRRDQCRQAPSDDPAARMMSSTTVTCGGVRGGGAREAVAMVIRRRTSTQQRASGRFSAASSGCRPS